jgi:DNA primase catalytic core
MARIAEEEIERINREVSVQRLAEARGVLLKPHGEDLVGLCPFHADDERSLVISPSKNLWKCLGECKAGGSVVDWVSKAEGVSFRHAVELLRNHNSYLAASSSSSPLPKRSTVKRLPFLVRTKADDQQLLRQVTDYYHETLKQSLEALAYLEKRGLKSSEMIERFKLGYANRTLGYRLPAKSRKAGAAIRGRLQKLGILRKSGHEHFHGSLVIPVFDEVGNITQVYGRKIRDDLRKGTPLHLKLPGAAKGVWNIEALSASKEIILCEGLIDALTFWCAGFRNVTSSYGIEGFTEDMFSAFKKYKTERVLIAYDRDEHGKLATRVVANKLLAIGINCYRIYFPRGMDANQYALKYQPASKSLGTVVRNAIWLGKGISAPVEQEVETVQVEVTQDSADDTQNEKKIPTDTEHETKKKSATSVAEPKSAVASPEPPPPLLEIPTKVVPNEVVICLKDRRWRIRGIGKNMSFNQLKVNVLVARGEQFHVDTLDLYTARQRTVFIKQTAEELGIKEELVKKDLGKVLLKLEELQEEQIQRALEPSKEKPLKLNDQEKTKALELLKDPNLIERILADFERCGVVGEETNKLTGYLAAVSRKLEEPLAVILQSSSAAGKTVLMEAILAFIPEEDQVKYSAITGQSLFYMGKTDLKHKILAIMEEEGAERASYALKLLQSEGELTIASTGKDPSTGKLVTQEYRVEGPVMILLTTTAVDIEEELLNRSIVLTVNEDREQTRAIHQMQRESQTLRGLLGRRDREQILKVHRNAQRLLRPLLVANAYAPNLTFLDVRTRTRRDHLKYLTLIRAISLLHQYQRPIKSVTHSGKKVNYIKVALEDIDAANRLANEILGRSLDELTPQTRRLLMFLDEMVTESCERLEMDRSDYRFSRRDVRQYTGWSDFQVKVHIKKLEALEYVLVHRGGRGLSFVYELLYQGEGQDGLPFLMGLIDVENLKHAYDRKKEHSKEELEPSKGNLEVSSSPRVAPKVAPSRVQEIPAITGNHTSSASLEEKDPENTHRVIAQNDQSYLYFCRSPTSLPLAADLTSDVEGG